MRAVSLWVALLTASASLAQAPKLPADLAAIPNDCFMFGHVRLADLAKNDAFKDVRAILQKAGPKALEALDKRFSPMPSSIDRISFYMPVPNFERGGDEPNPIFILSVTEPVDQLKLLRQFGKYTEKAGRNGGFFAVETGDIAIRFVDKTTIAFGRVDAIQHMVDNANPEKAGPLTPGLEMANAKVPVVFGLNASALPAEFFQDQFKRFVPEPLHGLFTVQTVIAGLDLQGDGHFHFRATFPDVASAEAAEKSLGALIDLGKGAMRDLRAELEQRVLGDGKPARIEDFPIAAASLLGLGALQHAEDWLDSKPIKRTGDTFSATLKLPPQVKPILGTAAVAASAAAPAIGKVREMAERNKLSSNLRQVGLAMHMYYDTLGHLPAAALADKDGKPLLSWRVAILPFIEQDNLYKQFKLDEPWDSEHNKKLIPKMPAIYAIPHPGAKPGETHLQVFVGEDAGFDLVTPRKLRDFTDGLSNTWLVVEAEQSVPWTKPADLEFDPKKDVPRLGRFRNGGFQALYADGRVRVHREVPEQVKLLIQRNDGQPVVVPD